MDSAALSRRLAELGHEPLADGDSPPVVAVRSAQQAADLLGTCTREGWRVRIRGAGTRDHDTAEPPDLVLSARNLTGFDIYEPDDLTVGALAGTTHAAAAAALARHQQLLPLDPPAAPAATLGGTFASGRGGPLRAGYGTPRDFALGLTVVTGDGRLLRLGGQVVKNVAGYDLVRLVVGSRGTLGFIAQLHARLRSLPQSDVTILADVRDPATRARLALELRDALGPVALELLSPAPGEPASRVAIRLHGSSEAVAATVARATTLLPGASPAAPGAASAFWAGLGAAEAAAALSFRLAAVPTALPVLVETAAAIIRSWSGNGLGGWLWAAHAADGVLRLWHPGPLPRDLQVPAELPTEVAARLASVSGTCICHRGPETARGLFLPPAPAPRLLELERELRLRFDPGSILVGA